MMTYKASPRDMQEYHRQIQNVEKAPLRDRQAAAADYLQAMQNSPQVIAERVGWLLNGSYGAGSYSVALDIANNKRCNQTANLGIMIAALEWQCPGAMARSAWNKLSKSQQDTLTALIRDEIEYCLSQE